MFQNMIPHYLHHKLSKSSTMEKGYGSCDATKKTNRIVKPNS